MKISTILDHIDSGQAALLLKEGPEPAKLVKAAGFRYFTEVEKLKGYVEREYVTSMAMAEDNGQGATLR
jgi:hypothetical protein